MKSKLFIVFLLCCSFTGFAQIKLDSLFAVQGKGHKVVAILPFKVDLKLHSNQKAKLTDDEYQKVIWEEGKAAQNATYLYLQDNAKHYWVNFQDINKTNAILEENGVNSSTIDNYTYADIAKMLNVDAIISGKLDLQRPLSDEGKKMLWGSLKRDFSGNQKGKVFVYINDGKTTDILWEYKKNLTRSFGSNSQTVMDAVMSKAERKFPYALKKG